MLLNILTILYPGLLFYRIWTRVGLLFFPVNDYPTLYGRIARRVLASLYGLGMSLAFFM